MQIPDRLGRRKFASLATDQRARYFNGMLSRALGRLFGLLAVLAVLSLSVQAAVAMPMNAGMTSAMSMQMDADAPPPCDDCEGSAAMIAGSCGGVCVAPAVLPVQAAAGVPASHPTTLQKLSDLPPGVLTSPEPYPPRTSSALQA